MAHRWILAAQSPKFRKLFLRKKADKLVVVNVPEEFTAVEAVIRYCYLGYVDDAVGRELMEEIIKVAQHLRHE
jgi:predicted phosphoribosyltransferase